MSARAMRPTRRDLLLVIVTFGIAYLFFTAPDHVAGSGSPASSSSSSSSSSRPSRLKAWQNVLSGESSDDEQCAVQPLNERSFEDTHVKVGFVRQESHGAEGKDTDEDESDSLESDEFTDRATKMLGHTDGWTMFENLYIYNSTFYVVTEQRSDWPELRLMTSTGLPAENVPGNMEAREPKGDEIIFITPQEAYEKWGNNVYEMSGMTWLFNDGQFIDHYYHFAAELLLSTWRVHSVLDKNIDAHGRTKIPPPARMWFLHQNAQQWRDRPGFNKFITNALFPDTAILYPEDMDDMRGSTSGAHVKKAYVLPKAILGDRSAAFRGPHTGPTQRTAASACQFGVASPFWWEPLRRQMARYSGVDEDIINRSLEGWGAIDPVKVEADVLKGKPKPETLAPIGTYRPVVTYISRQKGSRRLTPESHDELVAALEERAKKLDFELIIVSAETLTKDEQITIAARTTIMLGVHGNGLTHLLWMPATPRSAVIEMFFKGGFAHDYMWTTHALGMRHFAVQHDLVRTSPNQPKVDYPDGPNGGFQGNHITVVGKVVADIIEDRLAGRI